jgi:hypothetical protein
MNDTVRRLTAALADRYRLDRELGAGGMATVYLAHDRKHQRDVAIKVLRDDVAASVGRGRFRLMAPGGGSAIGEVVRFVETNGVVTRMYVGDGYQTRLP